MFYLLISVLCSVTVGVLLKLWQRRGLDMGQLVAWNYLAAALLAATVLRPTLPALAAPGTPWALLAALGIALPVVFLLMARSLRSAGIVRTDAAQRLSLLLSLAAAFTLFGEQANGWKLAGLGVGLLAIGGLLARAQPKARWANRGGSAWPWLLATWAGYGVIDIALKQVALAGTATTAALTLSFALAFVLMAVLQLARHARGSTRIDGRHLLAGLGLGVLNFGNILCYIRAHQAMSDSPAVVFAGMNIGVVALGTLAGVLLFGERTSGWNRAGLLLAVLAIVLIAVGAR
jgi:drug/metabolite transporter (DMT)-like permease